MEEIMPSKDFLFPFKPYKIQEEFMTQLYHTLETQKYGIFESPTGTGKSLSIMCSALKWLKDHNTQKEESLCEQIKLLEQKIKDIECSSSDWLISQSKQIEITNNMNSLRLEADRVKTFYRAIAAMKERRNKYKRYKQTFLNKPKKEEMMKMDDDNNINDGPEDDLLLEDSDNIEIDEIEDENEAIYIPTKIYICSRTHSQLSQLVGEIKKSPYSENIRVVSLASRQNYCINNKVTYLKSNALINEKCLDMQKKVNSQTKIETDGKCTKRKKTESTCKCPYYKKEAIDELKESIILNVQDVEDLVSSAKEFQACPYYASRRAVEYAEVILVPYNTILHKHTREANGIILKDNVVIIDEAHNLMDALAQMYGATLQANQVEMAHSELKQYKIKYGKRLSAVNFLHINQLLKILSALKAVFEQAKTLTTQLYTVNDFVSHAEIDHFNLFKIVEFIRQTKLSQKLHGFARRSTDTLLESNNRIEKKGGTMEEYLKFKATIDEELSGKPEKKATQPVAKSVSNDENQHAKEKEVVRTMANPMLSVISFLEALQHSNADGKILLQINEQEKKIQYLLLNASAHFSDIVKECRSVIVAGGTMKPISEFRKQLFINSGVDPARIVTFTCDHIIPPENILPIVLTNQEYLFNYENRLKMGNAIKTVLTNACKFVVGGIVVFFPSYKYESWAWDQVKNINFGRPVFREPQESGSVESVLDNYHKAIYKSQKKSAMLFSVVGGKLSEGLNFNDDLGRCVIVFGLPYANVNSPELKEKMTYLDKIEGAGAGKVFYENLCMKAVNQCVGRAIRHRNDYASVLLVDARYNRLSTKNMLPDWIKRSLKCCNSDEAFTLIEKFFSEKRKPQ